MNSIIPNAINEYAVRHSTRPDGLLNELEAYTVRHCQYPQMLVGPLEGALLNMLTKLCNARRVLEIGLYTGYSALCMAEALPDDGELISCDINEETSAVARSFFDRSPHGHKIKIRLGAALDTIKTLSPSDSFDLVFLDADKENYCAYYQSTLPLLKRGGLLIADNALWSGRVLNPEKETDHALAEFNTMIQNDAGVENVLLTVRDGIMLIRKK